MKKFIYSGGIISSTERDFNTFLSAKSKGSEEVWGCYELGKTYVAEVKDGKLHFVALEVEERKKKDSKVVEAKDKGVVETKDKDVVTSKVAELKVVNKNEFPLENGKLYKFLLLKIVVGELRSLEKIKVRNLGEISIEEIENYPA